MCFCLNCPDFWYFILLDFLIELLFLKHVRIASFLDFIPFHVPWLCARSWLARHPAKIEITRGSSHHTFFFSRKNHDFSRFLINFWTVVVVKQTHVVVPKRLTHIHSRAAASSWSGITSLRSKPAARSSDELTIIATRASEASVSADGSHSSKVRPESSSSTRCSHTSTRRAQSPLATVSTPRTGGCPT